MIAPLVKFVELAVTRESCTVDQCLWCGSVSDSDPELCERCGRREFRILHKLDPHECGLMCGGKSYDGGVDVGDKYRFWGDDEVVDGLGNVEDHVRDTARALHLDEGQRAVLVAELRNALVPAFVILDRAHRRTLTEPGAMGLGDTLHRVGKCVERLLKLADRVRYSEIGRKDGADATSDGTETDERQTTKNVDHPAHYTSHPSGVEAITVCEHMTFCVGNAVKYLWRAGLKGDDADDRRRRRVEDLRKAEWYVRREIERLEKEGAGQ